MVPFRRLLGAAVGLVAIAISPVQAIDADWTSYSDSAELPQSKVWRDKMKTKLNSIDPKTLSPENQAKYREMMFMLGEKDTL